MSKLYDDILSISRTYMGIAAKDYIDRRIRIISSGTNPEEITMDRIDRLIAGIEMTAKVYLSDTKQKDFLLEIRALKTP